MKCENCDKVGLQALNGYYYCQECFREDASRRETDVDYADYRRAHSRTSTRTAVALSPPSVFVDKSSLIWLHTQAQEDFGSAAVAQGRYKLGYEDYYNEVRIRYLLGMQWMIELQCEALVHDFHVTSLICGIASTVWLRFVAATGVIKDDWANRVISKSGREPQGADGQNEPDLLKDSSNRYRNRYPNEPRNCSDQRAVYRWLSSLKKAIPLSSSLAIVFLACHVAREAVLPTDIIKWSIEGKLSYFAAHVEIGKRFVKQSVACPISPCSMFRPDQSVPLQKLESTAASISESIGLHLPPVNFYEIASRYLKELSLPVEKILPNACRIYKWSMPQDLWLSTNETKFPTRVCVVSILIFAIRMKYKINGSGIWEHTLSTHLGEGVGSGVAKQLLDVEELLFNLEKKYYELSDAPNFAKDLPSYLQYCKDMVFVEATSHLVDAEKELTKELMNFYHNEKDSEAERVKSICNGKSSTHDNGRTELGKKRSKNSEHEARTELGKKRSKISEHEALKQLKLNMKENLFTYIPPRLNAKNHNYLHNTRKKGNGSLSYAAHADIYILLRAFAKVAQVDVRLMDTAVSSFERRLYELKEKLSLKLRPSTSIEAPDDDDGDLIGISQVG